MVVIIIKNCSIFLQSCDPFRAFWRQKSPPKVDRRVEQTRAGDHSEKIKESFQTLLKIDFQARCYVEIELCNPGPWKNMLSLL